MYVDACAIVSLIAGEPTAETYGVSRRALSNFDCFHYAYAKGAGAPMLTLDVKLRATDLRTRPL